MSHFQPSGIQRGDHLITVETTLEFVSAERTNGDPDLWVLRLADGAARHNKAWEHEPSPKEIGAVVSGFVAQMLTARAEVAK